MTHASSDPILAVTSLDLADTRTLENLLSMMRTGLCIVRRSRLPTPWRAHSLAPASGWVFRHDLCMVTHSVDADGDATVRVELVDDEATVKLMSVPSVDGGCAAPAPPSAGDPRPATASAIKAATASIEALIDPVTRIHRRDLETGPMATILERMGQAACTAAHGPNGHVDEADAYAASPWSPPAVLHRGRPIADADSHTALRTLPKLVDLWSLRREDSVHATIAPIQIGWDADDHDAVGVMRAIQETKAARPMEPIGRNG